MKVAEYRYSGIGLAIATNVAKAGGNLAIIHLFTKNAHEVAEKLANEYGIQAQAFGCDVGKYDLVEKTFAEIDEKMGPIHGWANSALRGVTDSDLLLVDFYGNLAWSRTLGVL